jgi:hypothetical protein
VLEHAKDRVLGEVPKAVVPSMQVCLGPGCKGRQSEVWGVIAFSWEVVDFGNVCDHRAIDVHIHDVEVCSSATATTQDVAVFLVVDVTIGVHKVNVGSV